MTLENNLIQKFYLWWDKYNANKLEPNSLVSKHPNVFWTFTPSSGAIFYIDLIKKGIIESVEDFSWLTVQPCLRLQDIPNSMDEAIDHSAFFRMATLHIVYGKNHKHDEVRLAHFNRYWDYLKSVGIEKHISNIFPVITDKGVWQNISIERDELAISFFKSIGIPDSNIILKPPIEQETIFSSRAEPFAGPHTELFFKQDDKLIEFGVITDFKYDRKFKETGQFAIAETLSQMQSKEFIDSVEHVINSRNIFGCAIGIERLAMLLGNHPIISYLDENKTLMKTVKKHIINKDDYLLEQINICDLIKISVFLSFEGLSPTGNHEHGRPKKFRAKILKPILEYAKSLEVLNEKFFTDMIDEAINSYQNIYPTLTQKR